ncbi:DUF2238 domain-containing protein [Alienimonas californiensis]|uniref:Inner membrane protein YjdF n=1 Tax=Alienimonas californiensis TaxID=2527989 RepID=A0A517P3J6_9PLAN|nr:DUF2238 domain-containing protein [Alienimonas californiensis]QDT13941.1 Inner membrane protein YjdF [Alienimonas californiensis]
MPENADRSRPSPWPGRWALLVGAVTVVSAIAPPHPWEQFLQHLATPLVLAVLWFGGRRGWLSGTAAAGVAVFFLLHAIAARFLYSTVPGGERLTPFSLGGPEGRNHFDRLVHFASGLLLAPVAAELAARFGGMKTAWACGFGVCLLLAIAAVYEVFEWSLTAILESAFADRYNGLQGDEWDAQKDMFLAGLGAAVALPASVRLVRAVQKRTATVREPAP